MSEKEIYNALGTKTTRSLWDIMEIFHFSKHVCYLVFWIQDGLENIFDAQVHACNCAKNAATGYNPYYLLYRREPRLPTDIEFALQKDGQKVPASKPHYVHQVRRMLKYAHRRAKQLAPKQQERNQGFYNRMSRRAELEVGDFVLISQTAWKGRHKIQYRWRMKSIK